MTTELEAAIRALEAALVEVREQRRVLNELIAANKAATAPTLTPDILPLPEFCKRLGRSRWWGYEAVRHRKIIPVKTGRGKYMIPSSQLENFIPGLRR